MHGQNSGAALIWLLGLEIAIMCPAVVDRRGIYQGRAPSVLTPPTKPQTSPRVRQGGGGQAHALKLTEYMYGNSPQG